MTDLPFSVLLGGYLLLASSLAFILFGLDKRRARRGQWRISEATLLGLALFGGSPGALLGMYYFRHKTRHAKFRYGLPLLLFLQLSLLLYLR